MKYEIAFNIVGLFVAAEHRIFNKKGAFLGYDNLVEKEHLELVKGCGIVGDRFFRERPDFNGHVTFFSDEVYQELKRILGNDQLPGPEYARRNIIVSGIDLKALYGQRFSIDGIEFEGTIHCAPCKGMDAVFGDGAMKILKGRGGLRARLLSSGVLRKGEQILRSNVVIDPKEAQRASSSPRLP